MMKRNYLVCILLITLVQFAKAQAITATGTIKNEQGDPVRYVFVIDRQTEYAVYSDSVGNYAIKANANDQLGFTASGYTNISITADKNMQVVLTANGSTGATGDVAAKVQIASQPLRANTTTGDMGTLADGGTMSGSGMAHKKGNTRGNRYMFDDFVPGYILNPNGVLQQNSDYLYDYDKIGGSLLMVQNKDAVTQIDDSEVSKIVLYDKDNKRYEFEKVTTIDGRHYILAIAEGKNYNIYKRIQTRLVKADYENNGITSHGADYDEFVDDIDYFVVNVQTKQVQPLSPKKKSVKADFAADADKVNKYISDNSGSINDEWLSKFGDFMNQ